MRLATHKEAGRRRLAAAVGDELVDLNRAFASLLDERGEPDPGTQAEAALPADVVAFLRRGAAGREAAADALAHVAELEPGDPRRAALATPSAEARLLPPVPNPPKVVCVARNYAEHAKEAGLELPEIPILFTRFAATLVASEAPLVRPIASDQFDWEGELALVIGRGGRRIPRAEAFDHIAGYSIFNDATVRDYQFRVTQYTGGKNFAGSGGFGPHLVTADEVADPEDLRITTHLNSELVQEGNTGDMIFDIPTLLEHVSDFVHLEPGDVIATGTPSGVGFKRKPPRFLAPGDEVVVAIDGLGELVNPVVGEEEL